MLRTGAVSAPKQRNLGPALMYRAFVLSTSTVQFFQSRGTAPRCSGKDATPVLCCTGKTAVFHWVRDSSVYM